MMTRRTRRTTSEMLTRLVQLSNALLPLTSIRRRSGAWTTFLLQQPLSSIGSVDMWLNAHVTTTVTTIRLDCCLYVISSIAINIWLECRLEICTKSVTSLNNNNKKNNKYVHFPGQTYIYTCRSCVHTVRDFTNGTSLAWRLRQRISTVMFTFGWSWPAHWPLRPILGFWGSKLHKKVWFPVLDADEPLRKIWRR